MSKFDVKACVNAAHRWDELARTGKRVEGLKLKPSKIRRRAKKAFARMQAAQAEVAVETAKEVAQTEAAQVAQAKEEK